MSIFYTEVPKDVANALNLRKSYYGADLRNSDSHTWLYRKMSYINARAKNNNAKNKRSASLTTPTEGGLGNNSLYKSNSNAKFIPKPHINTFKTSSDGDFGSLQKCELSFTVYSLADLDLYQAFLDIGADLIVNYGWSVGGNAAGKPGKFEGIIYNFSYTLNESGGFDCVSYGIAKGAKWLAVNVTAGSEISGITTDAIGSVSVSTNLLDDIQQLANKSTAFQAFVDSDGIGYDTIQFSFNDVVSNNNKIEKSQFYISLEKLVELINKNLLAERLIKTVSDINVDETEYGYQQNLPESQRDYVDGVYNPYAKNTKLLSADTPNTTSPVVINTTIDKSKFVIICNEVYTRGLTPRSESDLVSANPLQMIFPGYATYGSISYFKNSAEYIEKFRKGDISKILLNVNWIKELFTTIGKETQDRQKSADQSFSKFLLNIFNAISDNSGTRFKLSLTTDSKNDERFIITDINYTDSKVSPYILTAVNNQSICRRISLTSKVPSAMATVAFVAAQSSLTTPSTLAGEVLNGNQTVVSKEKISDLRKKVKDCATELGNSNSVSSSEKVSKLRIALKNLYEFTPSTSEYLNLKMGATTTKSLPFPIDFSATLDGIEGFTFGNTITTNYLPAVYKNSRVAFTVTRVEHLIQNNDWITTLSTICRLLPDDKNVSTENEYDKEDVSSETPTEEYYTNNSRTAADATAVHTFIPR